MNTNPASYKAILFDLDGVIIDTREAVTLFWERLSARHAVRLTPADYQQHIYGCPARHTLDVLFPQLTEPEQQAVEDSLYDYELSATYRAVPGVVALLQALRQAGVPTALVTSAFPYKVEVVSRQLGLDGLFTTRVTAADIRRGKPDPEGYLLAARRLHQSPGACIVFEDAVTGVQAAVTAGALCLGIQSAIPAPALLAAGAARVLPDFQRVGLRNGGAGLYLQADQDYSLTLAR